MSDKTYERILKLYNYSMALQFNLNIDLESITNEIFMEKNNILEKQREEELINPDKSRFFRQNMDFSKFLNVNAKCKKVPEMYKCKPEISFPKEEEFLKYSENQVKQLEANIYKKIAIILARRANLANRSKYIDSEAYTKKDMYMKEFLNYASIYNRMVCDEEKILYGFTENQNKGGILLDSSLPGYSRLSLHFGNTYNFYNILKEVNNFLQKKGFAKEFQTYTSKNGKECIDKIDLLKNHSFSLPRFNVYNTGIINCDNYNGIEQWSKLFLEKAKNDDASLNKNGIEEYVYILSEAYDDNFNDRELFEIAEKGGAGKKILESLNEVIKERKIIKDNAEKNNRTLMEEYVLSIKSEEFSTRIKEMYNNDNQNGDDTLNTIILNVAIKDEKINTENVIQMLKKAKDNDVRDIILEKMEENYYEKENAPSVTEILIDALQKYLHKQLYDIAKKVQCNEINNEEKEEQRLMEYLKSRN